MIFDNITDCHYLTALNILVMKKISIHLICWLLLSGTAFAQSKTAADAGSKPKAATVSQQVAALVKAITDSLNSQIPKANAKKTVYGTLTLTADQITVYNVGNTEKLNNPNLSAVQQNEVKSNTSKLTDDQKYTFIQIDTVEVTFKKNKITGIRIVSPTAGVAAFVGTIDPWAIKSSDTISVTIQHAQGTIRVSDFLSLLLLADVDDNLESGMKRLTKTSLKASINGY
jgi:hypothetical protein